MRSRKASQKGSVLLTTIILLSVVSFCLVSFMSYQLNMAKLGKRRRQQMKAFYVADVGPEMVIHWFNYPEDYTPDTEQFTKFESTDSYFDASEVSRFTSTIGVPLYMLPEKYHIKDSFFGELKSLTIYPSDWYDKDATDPVPSICHLQSVGISQDGSKKIVDAYLNAYKGFSAESPAAIISNLGITFGGQFNVFWGQVWSKEDVYLPNFAQTLAAFKADTKWLKLKTMEYIMMTDGKSFADGTVNGSVTPLPETAPNYYQPWLGDKWLDEIYQHQELTFPEYDYWAYKELAIEKGKYYGTDDSGNIYRGGIIDEDFKVTDIHEEFDVPDADFGPYNFIFIDTVDKQPPAEDGSNMCTIRLTGDAAHTKGVFYCANNVYLGGSGDPPDVHNAVDPDNNIHTLVKVRHQGLFYCSGQYDQQGQNTIYGSCVAKGGFGSGGCPEVYYDYRLADGTLMPIKMKNDITHA